MSLQLKKGVTSVPRETADGTFMPARGNRDGALFTADWVMGLALEGRVFCANAGTYTTPISMSEGSAIDNTEIDFLVEVPNGTTVIPISIDIYFEVFGSNGALEIMASLGTGGTFAYTGGSAVTPTNMRADAPHKSGCTIYTGMNNAVCTYHTVNVSEFWRDGAQKAVTKTTATNSISNWDRVVYSWSLKDKLAPPVAVGACDISIFMSGQAPTAFVTFIYAELPTNQLL